MSDYTKINFLDIDNSSKNEGLENHFARKFLDSSELGVSLFKYKPNVQPNFAHSHKVQEEVYVVVRGSGRVLLNDKTEDLVEWDVIRVAPEVVRAFASGPDGLDIIAVGGQKPEEGDGEVAEANWPK
jgi:mannose-6-phosphate isomerase-like protein (cupin superfamily)